MWTKKKSEDSFDESNPAFSMIADFDGNENGLFDSQMDEVVSILPLRNMVLFPTVVMPVTVGRKTSERIGRRQTDCRFLPERPRHRRAGYK